MILNLFKRFCAIQYNYLNLVMIIMQHFAIMQHIAHIKASINFHVCIYFVSLWKLLLPKELKNLFYLGNLLKQFKDMKHLHSLARTPINQA